MEFRQELIDLKGIGKIRAEKIISYALTRNGLINKLRNNYQEMIDIFRDDIVILLKGIYIPNEVGKNEKPQKKEAYKQDVIPVFDKKSLSRFVELRKNKVQFDCPNCGEHIQIVKGAKCPKCEYKIEVR